MGSWGAEDQGSGTGVWGLRDQGPGGCPERSPSGPGALEDAEPLVLGRLLLAPPQAFCSQQQDVTHTLKMGRQEDEDEGCHSKAAKAADNPRGRC